MPRPRNPKREQAKRIWLDNSGKIQLKEIAAQLGVSDSQVRNWKVADAWLIGDIVAQQNLNRGATKRGGAPKGNKNAAGNIGGSGGPIGNNKATRHGFFKRIFPDDDETHAIIEAIELSDPLEVLWQNIVIQYTAIARAQKIMFVQDQEDETRVIKRSKESENSSETEWEYQHAWDKQAAFMQAQSKAISTLEGLISRYEEKLPNALKREEQKLRIEKMHAEISKLKRDEEELLEDEEDSLDSLTKAIQKSKLLLDGGQDV